MTVVTAGKESLLVAVLLRGNGNCDCDCDCGYCACVGLQYLRKYIALKKVILILCYQWWMLHNG